MEELFKTIAAYIALVIESIGILMIAIGTVVAIANVLQHVLVQKRNNAEQRNVYLQYAGWLVAGLTFQLAGDIVHTAIAPSWDEIGKLAAIALIRTFLTYFLDKDMESMREKQKEALDK
ncbi:Uncharacterized conserved protein [Janthinobacterium sp. Marseille]|nr:DUF1622 domain-containing protein [Janthinobacterium sp. Marseille]ABR91454.1 Uncharacterized conserved protein [Janthinobacterium sp. Marseille]